MSKKPGPKPTQKPQLVTEEEAFSQDALNAIFRVSSSASDRLVSRESGSLEFKKSFNWAGRDDYARTIAGFANAHGGYIVFGVGNKPRKLIGLKSSAFEDIDPSTVSAYLNDLFSPEVRWSMHLHELGGSSFGLLHVAESLEKPLVARKNTGEIREGDILYRYRGRTERIKYSELRQILDEQRRREQRLWFRQFSRIARIGVANAAIMDLETGKVTGKGGTFVIDEELLPKLKFVKEGQFAEKEGSPTLRLVGELKAIGGHLIQPVKTKVKTLAIRTPEIVAGFLEQLKVEVPDVYLRQVCFETSGFLPIYHYIRLAGLAINGALELARATQSTASGRATLIKRLESDQSLRLTAPQTNGKAAQRKRHYLGLMQAGKASFEIGPNEHLWVAQAVRMLEPEHVVDHPPLALLTQLFNDHFAGANPALTDSIRRAIAYVDEALNRSALS